MRVGKPQILRDLKKTHARLPDQHLGALHFHHIEVAAERDAAHAQEMARLSVEFHMYIYQHCGNRYIAAAFADNTEMLLNSFRAVQEKRRQSKSSLVRWHSRIIEYLRAGDTQSISTTISEENVLSLREDAENA